MNNHPITKPRIYLQALKIAALSVGLALVIFNPTPVAAATAAEAGVTSLFSSKLSNCTNVTGQDPMTAFGDTSQKIAVFDVSVNKQTRTIACIDQRNGVERSLDQAKTWLIDKLWKELIKSGDIAWRQALKYFLNTLAYDMATYLATGDKGQLPMFQTEGWGGYLQNVADNAAGTFIESLGDNMGMVKFNLCNPDFNVLVKINLGLMQTKRPKAPACTFSKMTSNWEAALKDKDFLPKFQDMFNPWSNDLGIALTLQTGIETAASKAINAAAQDRIEGQGWKPVRSAIDGKIQTPADIVGAAARQPIADSTASEKIRTGTILADSVDIFINTLIGKLITKWLKGGLATSFPKLTNKLDSLTNINAQNPAEGLTGAQDRMKSIVEPNFKVRADYDILAELATCPDPNKAGPTNCAIDEKFRQAIEKKMTVGQAIKEGYLNGSGIFGFNSDGLEPKFNEGYPYRSMIILRKYRIIPVGWEVAAQYIKDCQNNTYVDQAKCKINSAAFNVNGTKNLNDLVECFNGSDEYGAKGSVPSWCEGLVDPDWVLKAPQNFCKREGAGPEIVSQQVTGEGSGSSLAILRNDTYCADEQSCVKEKNDGSCELYGYCTEERRKWDFNANSCAPLSNTCQTFGSSGGQTNSYLENTLDFGFCNLGNAGCQEYAMATSSSIATMYTSATQTINWGYSTQAVDLNKQAEACDSSSEGCHQFIRLNPGGGANLLINAGFEELLDIGGWGGFGAVSATPYQGSRSLELNDALTNSREVVVGTPDYNLAGESYALSFYAKCASGGSFFIEDKTSPLVLAADANNWVRYNSVYTYPANSDTNKVTFSISKNSGSCLIDNIKLERGAQATNFSNYAAGPSLIHEKLLPDYLMASCYADVGDHYAPISTAPAVCSDFARKCKRDEAGCELYTSTSNETKIPAKVKTENYCPDVCVGYNTFIQSATTFDSPREAYFIPRLAKACSAEANSCDQFTNLDEIQKGGEGINYYTALRQCVKPNTNTPGDCGDFYTWEGSDESGFQLKVESLASTNNNWPVLTTGDYNEHTPNECTEAVYNLPVSDPHHSNDCRQFYNTDGVVLYRLYSNTKTCTADCHPYRRTEVNVDSAITSSANCKNSEGPVPSCGLASSDGKDKCWNINSDPALSQCVSCKGGGSWSFSNQACIYMAVPSQGTTCAAAQNGCREYTGNTGNNIRKIFTDDFSNGTTGGWIEADSRSKVSPSNESLTLGADNKGHSILATTSSAIVQIKRQIGADVNKGLDYILNFVVRAERETDLAFSLVNANGEKAYFAPVHLTGGGWQILSTNLTGLNHDATSSEIIMATTTKAENFYISNIALTEIVDRYYLIKGSLRTNLPASCDEELSGAPHDLFMLGCDQYTDRASKTHYLKSFSSLCSESAVGCELMIDTHNSSVADATYYNIDGGKVDKASDANLTVPADNPVYVVYDQNKQCSTQEKGCERLGQAYKYEKTTLYSDVYLKNDPDKYGQILCGSNAVGCDIFGFNNGTTDNGEEYFKDPGDQVCDWRQQQTGTGASYGWYKKKVKRCDDGTGGGTVNGVIEPKKDPLGKIINPVAPYETNICLSDSGCSIVTEKNSIKCANDAACGDNGKNKCVKPSGEQTGTCRYSCITDNNDYKCPTDGDSAKPKTLGLGGIGNRIVQPDGNGWVGICPAADSGCTEYIDPMSKFNTNLLFNGSFNKIAVNAWDGWAGSGPYTQSVSLEPNTVYRLGRAATAGSLTIDNCKINGATVTAFYEIKNDTNTPPTPPSQILATPANFIKVDKASEASGKIFYYKGEANASCTVTAGDSSGAVELKKAVIDYQLSQNLDSKSCNGLVNTGQGCVLFNERKQDGANLAALNWDADRTVSGSPVGGVATQPENDSNLILKVAPDRVCNKWLACKSYIKDAKGDNVCFDVGLCDAVDGSGNCQSFISSPKTNQVADTLTASGISNLSGYSKVGISGGSLINDYYPFGAMEQKGEVANISNGGFEYSGSNGYPVGWSWSSTDPVLLGKPWSIGIFSIINNPIAVQTEGIGYAPEGASFLKLGSSYYAVSEQIDVMPKIDYIITAYLNTKNLKNGQARISIEGDICQAGTCTKTGIGCTTDDNCRVITQNLGNDWSFQMGKFNTGANSIIKVKLYSSPVSGAKSEGNFYFDDIKIRPALNSRTDLAKSPTTDWYTAQSCRLYPQTNSLSCDYYEDSGKRQKGWPGYCLEYDRRPGDPNTCLLWYPIDKVKGDGVEEGAGYLGKIPVYYCTAVQAEKTYEYRHAYAIGQSQGCTQVSCKPGYKKIPAAVGCSNFGGGGNYCNGDVNICAPDGKLIAGDGSPDNFGKNADNLWAITGALTSSKDGWYEYDEDLNEFDYKFNCWVGENDHSVPLENAVVNISPANKYAKFICDSALDQGAATTDKCCDKDKSLCAKGYTPDCACILTKEPYRSKAYCTDVIQTVTAAGQNKYWSSRVYKGSDYPVPGLGYDYETDNAPFGSMVPPPLAFNPYDWDGKSDEDGIQPMYYSSDENVARSGQGYGCSPAADCGFVVDDLAKDNFPYAYENLPNPTSLTATELIKRLFAQSYGAWQWVVDTSITGTSINGRYEPRSTPKWGPPGANGETNPICSGGERVGDAYCAILPKVEHIKIDGSETGPKTLTNSQFIKLSFNSTADSQQLPLVMYGVDWGDNSKTVVTGVEMRDKPNPDQPEIIYHLYSYWDLRAKNATDKSLEGGNTVYCGGAGGTTTKYGGGSSGPTCPADSACCAITPKIQIRDNWGWCNKGVSINKCDTPQQWNSFGEGTAATTDDWVVVKEKGESGSAQVVSPTCGNGKCDQGETTSCPSDCPVVPVIPPAPCGDGTCNASAGETPATCPADCQPAAITGPAVPKNIQVILFPTDNRYVKVTWDATNNTDTYIVSSGTDPNFLSSSNSLPLCTINPCFAKIYRGEPPPPLTYFSVAAVDAQGKPGKGSPLISYP